MQERPEKPSDAHDTAPPSRLGRVLGIIIPIAIIIIAIALSLLASRKIDAQKKEQPQAATPTPVNVIVEQIQITPELPDTLLLPALVEVNRKVQVSAEVAGRIMQLPCVEGAQCRKGDLLAALNTDLLQAEYERAGAQADFDAKQYNRMTYLEPQGAVTTEQVDEKRSQMEISKANMALAKTRLNRARITAPINGVLNKVHVEEGEYVQAGTLIADIVDIETVKVVVMAPEPDISYFSKGDKVKVLFNNHGTEKNTVGVIAYISEVADAGTRSTRIEIDVNNSDRLLRSGQIIRALMTRRVLKNVTLAPLLAIIPLEKGYRVYVTEKPDNAAQDKIRVAAARDITTSRIITKDAQGIDRIQILTGLRPGEQLIINGHRLVTDGQRVRVIATNGKSLKHILTEGKLGR